jgi:hypothetical protein
MNRRLFLLCLLAMPMVAAAPSALATSRQAGPQPWLVAAADDWKNLSDEERRYLSQHRGQWRNYSPEQRDRLRRGVQRYRELSPQERDRVRRQRERVERMTPEERRELRERYQRSRER